MILQGTAAISGRARPGGAPRTKCLICCLLFIVYVFWSPGLEVFGALIAFGRLYIFFDHEGAVAWNLN